MFNFFKKKQEPAQLCFNTDIHCHIIPGIDDGSPDVGTSIELIERMKGWGITRIVATPHVTQASFENTPEIMSQALDSLNKGLQARNINIDITHSAEYRIDELFLKHLNEGIIVPMPSKYILVENSFIQEPWNLDQLLFDLKVKGYNPILAHPERYFYYHQKQRAIITLKQRLLIGELIPRSSYGFYQRIFRHILTIRQIARFLLIKQLLIRFLS
jgi:tyrosine-protein phosphatase YwqE